MSGSIIDMMQDLVGAGPVAARRKADAEAAARALAVYVPRRVLSEADLDAMVAIPTTAIEFRAHVPTVVIVSKLLELQRRTGHKNSRRDLDNRVAETARMAQNIAHARRAIARWEARHRELVTLQPYDESARLLLDEYKAIS